MGVYLDNSATTRPTDRVVEAVTTAMRDCFYNPSALYGPALSAEKGLAEARAAVARSLQASERNVLFTSGGTESDNLAIFGLLQAQREPGDVLYTAAEHPAVKNACLEAAARFGHTAREAPLCQNGSIDLAALEGMLGEKTRLICVMQVCNETGVVMPLKEVCDLRDRLAPQAPVHVDGVQGYLRLPVSFRALKIQSYAISGHKINGPKGIGALVLADGARLRAQIMGGGQQRGLRSGTENTPGIAGLRAAIETYPTDAYERMRELKRELAALLKAGLPETVVVGLPPDDPMSAGHIVSLAFPPVRAETLVHALEADGICVGTGSACSSKKGRRSEVLAAMRQPPGVMDGAIRISLCPENTREEMRYTAEKIIEKVTTLRRFSRR